jgi:thiamine biosynthesis protein ThiC
VESSERIAREAERLAAKVEGCDFAAIHAEVTAEIATAISADRAAPLVRRLRQFNDPIKSQ